MTDPAGSGLVSRYLRLGLELGRHIDGLVDAYYGPAELAAAVWAAPPPPPATLAAAARRLIVELDGGADLGDPAADGVEPPSGADAGRRRWLRAQVVGLETTARRLAGEPVPYADEVERCYGVRPVRADDDAFTAAHRQLDEVLPGTGDLAERLESWRDAHVVPRERLGTAIAALAEELRARTGALFGLPEGERVEFELVTDQPWAGFNYYLGNLHSRVAVNTDLPVLSVGLAHLVAHEAYPGHHTEHARKEVGLVRRRRWWEESIFLVGTPQCLMAEGLADLGLEVVLGSRPESTVASILRPLGIRYDADAIAALAGPLEVLGGVRQNAAFRLHEDGADPDIVIDEVARAGLLPRARAAKAVQFLTHPTWRAYMTCYAEGMPRCRAFVGGDPSRFERLVTEQLLPADLADVPRHQG